MVVVVAVLGGCGDGSSGGAAEDVAVVRRVDEAPAFADCPVETSVFDVAGSPSDDVAPEGDPSLDPGTDDAAAVATAVNQFLAERLPTFGSEYPAALAPYEFVEVAPVDDVMTEGRVGLIGADGRAVLDLTLEPYGPAGWRVGAYRSCQETLARFNPGTDGPEATFAEVDDPEG